MFAVCVIIVCIFAIPVVGYWATLSARPERQARKVPCEDRSPTWDGSTMGEVYCKLESIHAQPRWTREEMAAVGCLPARDDHTGWVRVEPTPARIVNVVSTPVRS